MTNKRSLYLTLFFIFSLVAVLLFGACAQDVAPSPSPAPAPSQPDPAPAPAAEPVTLKAVVIFDEMNIGRYPFQEFQDRIEEKSNGELVIEYIGGPEAIPQFDQGMAVKEGIVDMAFLFTGAYRGVVPGVEIQGLSEISAAEERECGYYDFMLEQHKENGIFYLGRGVRGGPGKQFYMFTKDSISSPKDLSGKRIAGVGMSCDSFVKALGATHVVLGWGELYTALQRGTVDGYWLSLPEPPMLGLVEVCKYTVDHSFYADTTTFIVNLDSWNKLPTKLQDLMIECMKENENETPALETQVEADARSAISEQGGEFIKFSPADAQSYIDLAYDSEWATQTAKYPDFASKAKNFIAK